MSVVGFTRGSFHDFPVFSGGDDALVLRSVLASAENFLSACDAAPPQRTMAVQKGLSTRSGL